jgi:hypothetical protein
MTQHKTAKIVAKERMAAMIANGGKADTGRAISGGSMRKAGRVSPLAARFAPTANMPEIRL